jgi:hypothetical protein
MTRMATSKNENLENRVLVYMPTGRDAELVCITLGNAGIEAEACGSAKELESSITSGAGAVLLVGYSGSFIRHQRAQFRKTSRNRWHAA